jgi:hypothetical protein
LGIITKHIYLQFQGDCSKCQDTVSSRARKTGSTGRSLALRTTATLGQDEKGRIEEAEDSAASDAPQAQNQHGSSPEYTRAEQLKSDVLDILCCVVTLFSLSMKKNASSHS